MSDARYLDIDMTNGEMVRRRPITSSGGVDDAFKIVSTRYDGVIDPSMIPATGGAAADIGTFPAGANGVQSFTVVSLIEEALVKASALDVVHADAVVGVALQAGAINDPINVQMGGLINFPTAVFGPYRGLVYLGSNGTLSPTPVPGSWFVKMLGTVVSDSALELDLGGWLVILDAAILPGEGSVPYATTSEAGIVVLSEHGEMTPTEVVQADDPRVTGYHHTQSSASTLWTISHMMNKFAVPVCRNNAGEIIVGEITWTSRNQVQISWSEAVAGHAYLA